MKTWILRFRTVDKIGFDAIRKGLKIVETRAATKKYRNVKVGDTIIFVFVCGKERLRKRVKRVRYFKTRSAMFRAIPWKKVMPYVSSLREARAEYLRYSGYREKLKKFGLIAMEIK